ncbi:nonstructural protein [Apis mellifera associated microvirus 14]|nr:nonstructural protein [Apis mellifera associated microvirus 14]
MQLYAIYDIATRQFGQVIMEHNDATAERAVKTELMNRESMLAKHPQDYELWRLATYQQESGEVVADKERIARVIDYANAAN